jgi:hypothetical protein
MQVKAKASTSLSFEGVRESGDEFLSLFPHRFDYIYAKHPELGKTPDWQTESRHPLSDRLIRQGSYLYGVRFGLETHYCLLDIDAGSVYHPNRDPFAISRIVAALEDVGLVSHVTCTSSYSGGLHLYFPFEQPQKSWNLAVVLETLLENAGFKLVLGQLEIFPNPKLYVAEGKPNLYAAHRLPMQAGSYLVNDRYELTYSSCDLFVQQWRFAQQRNDIHPHVVETLLKSSRRKQYCISGKADKFLNDLNADIEPGWTGYGQTNYILGRIAMRSYVFGHLLCGSYPLEGKALVADIVRVAKALPGYQQWCRHQHEIEKRAEEWARCVETSHYFHFGIQKLKSAKSDSHSASAESDQPTWNQRQSEAARERIRNAIANMLETRSLPISPTERFQALTRYQIGGGSLYRHRDLWHPSYLAKSFASERSDNDDLDLEAQPGSEIELINSACADVVEPVENDPIWINPIQINDGREEDCGKAASSSHHLTSLLAENGSNARADVHLGHCSMPISSDAGDNFQGKHDGLLHQMQNQMQVASNDYLSLQTAQTAIESQQRAEAHQAAYLARLQRYLASGDPILMAEAIALSRTSPRTSPGQTSPESPSEVAVALPGVVPPSALLPSETPGLPSPQPNDPDDPDDPDDLSNILVAISVHLRRLRWLPAEVGDRLHALFGKRRQMLLTDAEILEWLDYLEQQD